MNDRSLLAARTLVAIVEDGRATNDGCDERPLDALLLGVLREVPVAAAALLGCGPKIRWRSGEPGLRPDIVGYEPGSTAPDILLEVKGRHTKYNFPGNVEGSLDIYQRSAPQARCFIAMPERRAIKPGEVVDSAESRGRRELLRPNKDHASADHWRIITFEQIAEALAPHLPGPTPTLDEPDLYLLATMMRVQGLEP